MPDVKPVTRTSKTTVVTTPTEPTATFSIAGLVLGIIGVVIAWVPIVGFVVSALGIIFGALGYRRGVSRGLGLAGLITGIVGAAIAIFFGLAWILFLSVPDHYMEPQGPASWHYYGY